MPCAESRSSSRARALPLIGRGAERARLERLLTSGTVRGDVLLLRGAPGVGKTALLVDLAKAAVDHRVMWVRGGATEADLPYSALHLLCSAMTAQLGRLERHQRETLETAVGLRAGPPPDRLLVSVAVVALLSLAAETRPVLCVVDDTQWLDPASAGVLAFVARRLGEMPVTLLFAGRRDAFAGLPHLALDGLNHADARRLFDMALPAPIDAAVVERMVTEARGNPRLLIESARAASPVALAGGYGAVASNDVEDGVLAGLAPDSRLLLVLAAAEPLGDPARLWRAAGRLGIPGTAAEPLESEGLLSFGARVAFREPRLRRSVYGLASPAERRRVHGALAAATDEAVEPDRRVWHLAQASVEPDDAIGDELARSVRAARKRGGVAAAAAFLEQAALHTANPGLRADRAIMAADAYHAADADDAAVRLLAMAELCPVHVGRSARANRMRARIVFDATRDRAAVAALLRAAQDLEQHQPQVARSAYLEALGAAIFNGHLDVVRTALGRLARHQPGGVDRLLEGVAQRYTGGYAASAESLKLALKALDCDHEDDTRSRLLACLVAPDLWDDDTWHELTQSEVERSRQAGARTSLPYVLTHRALLEIHTGQFITAESLVAEAEVITEGAGAPPFTHAAVVLAAWRGHEHPALGMTDSPRQADEGMAVTMARYARAVLSNGRGAYGDAVTATRQAVEDDGLRLHGWSLAELVEGAVRSGDLGTAATAVERLCEQACLSGTDWALGIDARSRALVHTGRAAEDLYVEAIARLGRSRITTHLARAQLVYGEWLRRQGRRVDARAPLRAAHLAFVAMGAEAFAGRAMQELLATGERARRRVAETRGQLTPQEVRIASMARDGRSNPEIAMLLSISPRTVEYHLHKVFTKLNIRSRTELHLVLTDAETSRPGTPLRRTG